MKSLLFLLFACLLSNISYSQAQTASGNLPVPQPLTGLTTVGYQAGERGSNHCVWEKIVRGTDSRGNVVFATNEAYVELATGLNYRDAVGQWQAAREEIDPCPGGAVAQFGQHQIAFAANLNTPGCVNMLTPDGKRLQSEILGLCYFDVASDKTAVLATVKDCQGAIVNGNQVLYVDAFDRVAANVRYTYTKAGLKQDVFLEDAPPAPENFGLASASTMLQVITEFVSATEPTIASNEVPTQAGSIADQDLDFGVMKMARGKAFLPGTNASVTPVAKQWAHLAGKRLLFETVPVASLTNAFGALPIGRTQPSFTGQAIPIPERACSAIAPVATIASVAPDSGYDLDYTTISTSQSGYTFQGDTTYFISAPVNLAGTTTFEGDTVIKFNYGTSLNFYDPAQVTCLGAYYRPIVFTTKDDDTVGEMISSSYHTPYSGAACAINFNGSGSHNSSLNLQNFRISYAGEAIAASGISVAVKLKDGQIVNCPVAFYSLGQAQVTAENVLFANCTYAFELGIAGFTAENATFYGGQLVYPVGSGLQCANGSCINCVIANVNSFSPQMRYLLTGDHNAFYNSGQASASWYGGISFGASPFSPGYYPFVSAGAGNFYLTPYYLDKGTMNIDPYLLADLRTKTILPPNTSTYIGGAINSPANLYPQVSPSTGHFLADTSWPDLGYHYDILDYLVSDEAVNANLTLRNGVALGAYGAHAFQVSGTSQFSSQVDYPYQVNWIVRHNSVQEQSVTLGEAPVSLLQGNSAGPALNLASLSVASLGAGFTAGSRQLLPDVSHGGSLFSSISLWNCRLYDLTCYNFAELVPSVFGMTNCCLERCSTGFLQQQTGKEQDVSLINNLFWRGDLAFLYLNYPGSGTKPWSITNNAFDGVGHGVSGADDFDDEFAFGYNGYINTSPFIVNYYPGPQNIVLSGFNYATSALGRFYQQSTSFVDNGDPNSLDLALNGLTFTTRPDQTQDQDPVDIGYHYPIIAAPAAITTEVVDCFPEYISASDPAYGLPITYFIVTPPSHGTLDYPYDAGELIYTPNPGYIGLDTFTYEVFNGYVFSAPQVVSVIATDPGIVALSQTAMTGIGQPLALTLTAQKSCQEPLTFSITQQPQHGSLSGTPPNIIYTPQTSPSSFEGWDSFWFTASDGISVSGQAMVTVFVLGGPNLSASCTTGSPGIQLAWTLDSTVQTMVDQATMGFNIQDFKIYRSVSGGPYSLLYTAGGTKRSTSDLAVTPGVNYCYFITPEYADSRTQIVYPVSPPVPATAPYSTQQCCTACQIPFVGQMDIAFIIDNTGSMTHDPYYKIQAMPAIQAVIGNALSYIAAASSGSYRIALVTPDNDQVNVRYAFGTEVSAFETALSDSEALVSPYGHYTPESTDECINTCVNHLAGGGSRTNPEQSEDGCSPWANPLQIGDFSPFNDSALKFIVLITDAPPGGFCDPEVFSDNPDGNRARSYATDALSKCVKINAIQIWHTAADPSGQDPSDTQEIMQDYGSLSCGWYSSVDGGLNADDMGEAIEAAILNMFYNPGDCNCP